MQLGPALIRVLTTTTCLSPRRRRAKAGDGDGGKDDDATAKTANDDDKGKADAEGPPETYELKVTVQGEDGKDEEVPIDAELLAKATPILKEIGLTNEQANKVAALVPELRRVCFRQQADDFTALKTEWAKAAKEDKEIGGAKWKETEAFAAKALDTFGAAKGSDFRKLLDESASATIPR
jgi:hypothetical protein